MGDDLEMRIAISGKQGAGKTELANTFINEYGFEQVGFAKKLKESAMDIFGLTYEQAFGKEKDRKLLQDFGTYMRQIDTNVWVNAMVRNLQPGVNYVVDDLRYENEFQALKDAGFLMVRIEASEETRKTRIPNTFGNPTHPSEVSLDNETGWDYIINNDGIGLDVLQDLAKDIYKRTSGE